jgi:hypothetical protein
VYSSFGDAETGIKSGGRNFELANILAKKVKINHLHRHILVKVRGRVILSANQCWNK